MTNGDLWRKMTNEQLATCISMLSNKCYKDVLEELNAEADLSMGVSAEGLKNPKCDEFIKKCGGVMHGE